MGICALGKDYKKLLWYIKQLVAYSDTHIPFHCEMGIFACVNVCILRYSYTHTLSTFAMLD